MKPGSIVLLLIVVLNACVFRNKPDENISFSYLKEKESNLISVYSLFNDSNYIFILRTIDTINTTDIEKSNTVVCVIHINGNAIDTLTNDSLFNGNMNYYGENNHCIAFADYNFDGIKDIALPAGTAPG